MMNRDEQYEAFGIFNEQLSTLNCTLSEIRDAITESNEHIGALTDALVHGIGELTICTNNCSVSLKDIASNCERIG